VVYPNRKPARGKTQSLQSFDGADQRGKITAPPLDLPEAWKNASLPFPTSQSAPHRAGVRRHVSRPGVILYCTVLDWTGLDWTGLDWTGLILYCTVLQPDFRIWIGIANVSLALTRCSRATRRSYRVSQPWQTTATGKTSSLTVLYCTVLDSVRNLPVLRLNIGVR
jgi:hypothetical protein